MAFVNERISEEDKAKYKISEIPDYPQKHWNSWTIDRDRYCFLLYNGMSHDLPFQYFFIFSYQGYIAKIDVEVKGNGKSPEGVNLTDYDICRVKMSEQLKVKQDEILRVFSEAVEAKENARNVNRKVTVLSFGKKLQVN